MPEFEQRVLENKNRLKVEEYSQALSKFYMDRWNETTPSGHTGPNVTFVVGGYDKGDAYGKVFLFEIPGQPNPKRQDLGDDKFGMTWGGQLDVACRLVHGFDPALISIIQEALKFNDKQGKKVRQTLMANLQYPIPYQVLPLQDCIDLAIFLIRTTVVAQNLAIAVRGVGGPIDVAVITRTKGLQYVQQKEIHGEEYGY